MCGYCIEQSAFAFLQASDGGRNDSVILKISNACAVGYMQDCADFVGNAVQLTEAQIQREHMDVVLCCRAICLLLEAGHTSPEYQALLSWPLFAKVVEKFCAPTDHAHQRSFGLPWLRNPRVFYDPGYLGSQVSAIRAGWPEITLRRYVDSRREVGLPLVMPALWLALYQYPRQEKPRWSVLFKVATHRCLETPDANDLSLWLGRQAILMIYDHLGPAAIVAKLFQLRPTLLQFLALMRPLPATLTALLIAKLGTTANQRDHFDNCFSLRTWLTSGDLQIARLEQADGV